MTFCQGRLTRICKYFLKLFRSIMDGFCNCNCCRWYIDKIYELLCWICRCFRKDYKKVPMKEDVLELGPVGYGIPRPRHDSLEMQDQIEMLTAEAGDLRLELHKERIEKEEIKREKDYALTRLSEVMSLKLRDNNPNIADLSDDFRPTKLAEISSELYDNEWTTAFSNLEKTPDLTETDCIQLLLDILMETYTICKLKHEEEWRGIRSTMFGTVPHPSREELKLLKDTRRKYALGRLQETENNCLTKLKELFQTQIRIFDDNMMLTYVSSCVKLNWMMQFQDPPVIYHCPNWTTRSRDTVTSYSEGNGAAKESAVKRLQTQQVEILQADQGFSVVTEKEKQDDMVEEGKVLFDGTVFREYTKRGRFLAYITWPAMYLHEGGPLLCKGVAQGCD